MSSLSPLPTSATRRLGLLALGLATLLPMLGGSLANMVLPALGQAFAVPFASLQWVLVAYLLGITCLTVVAGRLGDRFGRRRLLLLGLGLFALASLLCALAPTIGWLIAARALQGIAAACMLSLALAMVGQLVPPARRGWGMGLLGTLSACGTALGPSFGGLLTASFGWQAPFLLLVPLSLLALGCARLGLPRDDCSPQEERISLTSLSQLVVTLLCYGLALTQGGALALWWGAGALLVTGSFVRRERRVPVPLLPLALLGAPGQFGPLGYLLPILLLTAGYALFQTANNSAVVGEASEQTRGAVAGLLTLSRNLGQLTGVAGLGGLFAALVGEQGLTLASELVFGTRALFALSTLLIGLAFWLVGRRREGVPVRA
ncbi:MFS transporter [Aeromonas media]|uniref:MFS transporter n=1 Tax=Aeromonas media TaxID=651 RepID=UPI0005BE7316|nr:MFS transporter [Aeromonas media]